MALLNDVGPEVGLASGTLISDGSTPYTRGPHYIGAYNKILTFKTSGNWNDTACGSRGGQNGKDWMKNVCG